MENIINIEGFSVKIRQNSPRVRNFRITVKSENEIFISAPLSASRAETEKIVRKNIEWIRKSTKKIINSSSEVDSILDSHNDEFLYFGEWVNIRELTEKNISKKRERMKDILMNSLREYIKTSTEKWAKKMGVEYKKISINSAKTRLGSCSWNNSINFSMLLVCADKELIDYVVIHELAHIKHKDHSDKFWSFVAKYCHQYRECRHKLKKSVPLFKSLYDRIEDF